MRIFVKYGKYAVVWLREHQEKLLLALSYILVAALCFEAGWLRQSLVAAQSVKVEVREVLTTSQSDAVQKAISTPAQLTSVGTENMLPESCFLVGSKKSNKYHDPRSRCAKQIKPENRICFASLEVAQARHYVAGCLVP